MHGTDEKSSKFIVFASWQEVPHLDEKIQEEMLSGTQEYLRDARSRGIPFLGAGRIYPINIDNILIDDFPIPNHWKCGYGFDVGRRVTAAIFGAWDEQSDIVYWWSEHYGVESSPAENAAAILARPGGRWMPGFIDPSANGDRRQTDGRGLADIYREELGLKLQLANNAVDSGIQDMWLRLSTGRMKVFKSMHHFIREYGLYSRDAHGKIVKKYDHLQDGARYALRGLTNWTVKPAAIVAPQGSWYAHSPSAWMAN